MFFGGLFEIITVRRPLQCILKPHTVTSEETEPLHFKIKDYFSFHLTRTCTEVPIFFKRGIHPLSNGNE